jgi:hypothetical protein
MEAEIFSRSSVFALSVWSAVRRHLEEAPRTGDKTLRERANAALAALSRQR